ncbi:MAG: nitrate reductase molybdenum cofactor assembly chaperone [Desulfobacterales bacterium]|jgi:nitrate reductase delta subunit
MQATLLKIYSLLLADPGHPAAGDWPGLSAEISRLPEGPARRALSGFLHAAFERPKIQLREMYTGAFVLSPATTLNMTYHLWGDTEKRAQALVRLQQVYLDAGYEPLTGELPDHLPLMLEFLGACPEARGADRIWESLAGLEGLVERLRPTAPMYADLLHPLVGVWQAHAGEKETAASEVKGDCHGPGL